MCGFSKKKKGGNFDISLCLGVDLMTANLEGSSKRKCEKEARADLGAHITNARFTVGLL